MARTRPRSSKAASKSYAIHYTDAGKLVAAGELLNGQCDHQKLIIRVDAGQHLDNVADTLIHEVLHQLLTATGTQLPEDLEELVANTLGTAIFAHVRDNPDFWKYITRIAWPRKPRSRKPSCPSPKPTLTPSSPSSPSSEPQ